MENVLFKISDLICSYDNKIESLKIKDLILPKNKIIILLGKSGAGKSTILETLGLMNMTIKSGSVEFFPNGDKKGIQFEELWKNKNDIHISDIRNKYFSFIFQNTNLMPNFTAYENACLTQMIQGVSQQDSEKKVTEMMTKLGLDEVAKDKMASELSGGQRQRLAFVRAITSDFTVLFGDEPTGNIDEFTSTDLMDILYETVRKENKTAIIVSHNIDLTIKYADMIIVLEKKDDKKSCGEIKQENIFYSIKGDNQLIQWRDNKDKLIEDVRKRIKEVMTEEKLLLVK